MTHYLERISAYGNITQSRQHIRLMKKGKNFLVSMVGRTGEPRQIDLFFILHTKISHTNKYK